jgi:hypothetical protein
VIAWFGHVTLLFHTYIIIVKALQTYIQTAEEEMLGDLLGEGAAVVGVRPSCNGGVGSEARATSSGFVPSAASNYNCKGGTAGGKAAPATLR